MQHEFKAIWLAVKFYAKTRIESIRAHLFLNHVTCQKFQSLSVYSISVEQFGELALCIIFINMHYYKFRITKYAGHDWASEHWKYWMLYHVGYIVVVGYY